MIKEHQNAAHLGVPETTSQAARPVATVGEAQHIKAWDAEDGWAVGRVEVAAEDALVEALHSEHHPIRRLAVREPVQEACLHKLIVPAGQVRGIRDLDDGQSAGLREPDACAHEGGFIGRPVEATAPPKLVLEPFADAIVPAVLHILAHVHDALVTAHELRDGSSHQLAHVRRFR